MSPDSPETRLRVIERELAQVQQRVADLVQEVHDLNPLVVAVTRLEATMGTVKGDVESVKLNLRERDKQATDERRSVRIALIGLTATIIASLIGGAAALIVGLT